MSILAAIETDPGSEETVRTAYDLASGLGKELVLTHVLAESGDREKARASIEEIIENAVEDRDAVTLRLVEESGGRTELPSGRVADAVLRVADNIDAEYIVVGTRKKTPVGKVMLGSVAQTVLLNAEVPVLTVQQSK